MDDAGARQQVVHCSLLTVEGAPSQSQGDQQAGSGAYQCRHEAHIAVMGTDHA
jgi:hypothetical protein